MTSDPKDLSDPKEEALLGEMLRSLDGEMIPTSVKDVIKAEGESALQEALASEEKLPHLPFVEVGENSADDETSRKSGASKIATRSEIVGSEGAKVIRLSRLKAVAMPAAGFLLGAAAMALVFKSSSETKPPGLYPAGESVVPSQAGNGKSSAEGALSGHRPLQLGNACADCCGGEDCNKESIHCISGRSCSPCQLIGTDRFLIKIGDVSLERELIALSEFSQKTTKASAAQQNQADGGAPRAVEEPNHGSKTAVEASEAEPLSEAGRYQLCLLHGGQTEHCIDALNGTEKPEPWRRLGVGMSRTTWMDTTRLELRERESGMTVASYENALVVMPARLCQGMKLLLRDDNNKILARLSAYFEESRRFELGRSADLESLRDLGKKLSGPSVQLQIYETTAPGDRHFALTAGPFLHQDAEKIRWQLLEQKLLFVEDEGQDYRGEPLLLQP